MTSEDAQLLRSYVAERSESAFSELIRRHVDLVYSAALRLSGGDPHRAQDVTQLVFVELARQANRLKTHPALAGWLYTTTRFMALRMARTEQRRMAREQEAYSMSELLRDQPLDWDDLRPILDEAMHQLGETDRLAVLLRFFQNKSLREVGQALGLTDNAARMRLERALEKLRLQLAQRGVTSTSAALASALSAKAVAAAPAGLVAKLASASLAATSGAGTAISLLKLMAMEKLKVALATLVLTGAATTVFVQHQEQTTLGAENRSLRHEVARLQDDTKSLSERMAHAGRTIQPRLPAPKIQPSAKPPPPLETLRGSNVYARFMKEAPKLTAAQLESYLKANGRKASSLLAAYRSSGDKTLLYEAMEKFPNDPQVALEGLLYGELPSDQHRQWLNAFEQSAPDNALANYLSAYDYFKAGQTDQAVQELVAGSGKRFHDYTLERMQDNEEAYLAAGYSVAEAKWIGSFNLNLSHLPQLRELGLQMVEIANSYRQAGDGASAQSVLQMAAGLGQNYDAGFAGDSVISQFVGTGIERSALSAMDPQSSFDGSGQTVRDRLDQVMQKRNALKMLVQQSEPILQTMPDEDWISYIDRLKSFGEEAALKWIISKYGTESPSK